MATATFLSGATCSITPTGGAAVDVSDQLSKCEVMVGFELLESTSLADTGRQATKGLQSVAVNLDLYLSYGATEVKHFSAQSSQRVHAQLLCRHQAQSNQQPTQSSQLRPAHWMPLRSSCRQSAPLQSQQFRSPTAPGHET